MSNQKINALTQIFFSSFYVSSFSNQKFSIPDVAIDLTKLSGSYEDQLNTSLQEFDGIRYEDVEDSIFQGRYRRIENKILRLTDKFKVPIPIKRKVSTDDNIEKFVYVEGKSMDKISDDSIIGRWLHKLNPTGGKQYFKFESDDLKEAKKKLLEISRHQIKLIAMDQVADEAALKDSYQFHKDFNSVPDACKHFKKKLGDEYTRDLLKEKIKTYAQIYEDGDILDDWSTINARINAWARHEENKYK